MQITSLQSLFRLPSPTTAIKITAQASAYTLLFSAATGASGSLLLWGGSKLANTAISGTLPLSLQTTAKAATWIGLKLLKASRISFLSVSVPTYLAFYKLPHFLVTRCPQLIHEHILTPLAQYAITIANLAHAAGSWVWNRCITPLTEQLIHAIDISIQSLYSYILKPIGTTLINSANWTWNNCILPAGQQIAKIVTAAFNLLNSQLIQPIAALLTKSANWIWNTCLLPAADHLCQAIVSLGNMMISALEKLYTRILVPSAQALVKSISWIWNTCLLPLLNTTSHAANQVLRAAKTIGLLFYKYLIKFPITCLAKTLYWTWQNGISPTLQVAAHITSAAAQRVYTYAIQPLLTLSYQAAQDSFSFAQRVCQLISTEAALLWNNTAQIALGNLYK